MTKEQIIAIACDVCGVDTIGGRNTDNAMAMHLAMYFMRWELNMDIKDICAEFGLGKTAIYEHIDMRKVTDRRRFGHPFGARFNSVALKIYGGCNKRKILKMTDVFTEKY